MFVNRKGEICIRALLCYIQSLPLTKMKNTPWVALRESNPFGLKWKIACLPVLKKLDNSLIVCTFLPCNPTYFLI